MYIAVFHVWHDLTYVNDKVVEMQCKHTRTWISDARNTFAQKCTDRNCYLSAVFHVSWGRNTGIEMFQILWILPVNRPVEQTRYRSSRVKKMSTSSIYQPCIKLPVTRCKSYRKTIACIQIYTSVYAVAYRQRRYYQSINVTPTCTADDMSAFISGLSVNVVSCFEAKTRRRRGDTHESETRRKAFRVCVHNNDFERLLNDNLWPESITTSE